MKALLGILVFMIGLVITPFFLAAFLIIFVYVAFHKLGTEAIEEFKRWNYKP